MGLPKRKSVSVGFRLDDENGDRLKRRAQASRVSIHEYARGILLEHLAEQERGTRTEQRLEAMTRELRQVRLDLGAVVFLLAQLITHEEPVDLDQVADFLRQRGLHPKEG